MGQYSSYYLYQKYVSRDGGDFVPVYPEVFSIDADGTMPKVIRLEEDTACGFNPNPDAVYRWQVKYVDENDYICYNYSKYYYEYYQVSYNNGVTWQDVTPIQKRRSNTVWEANSYDCGYGGDMYEWRKIEGEYICEDCGDEPEPLNALFKLSNTNNGNVYQLPCTSDGRITSGMTNTLVKSNYNTLQIGNCCKEIGGRTFSGWTLLEGSLVIPNSVETIGINAFPFCYGFNGKLKLGTSLTSIGNSAFYECTGFKGNLTIPDKVTIIDSWAFGRCSGFTGSLTIPNSVTTIGNGAFTDCYGLNGTLTLGTGLTSIGYQAFVSCRGLTGNLVIPNKITIIEPNTFNSCTGFNGTLTLPTGLTTIGNSAFNMCSGLTGNLVIPNKVTSIGNGAFNGCRSLTSIYCKAPTPPTLGITVFDNTNNCPIYVPNASVDAYKTATNWSDYADRIRGY